MNVSELSVSVRVKWWAKPALVVACFLFRRSPPAMSRAFSFIARRGVAIT